MQLIDQHKDVLDKAKSDHEKLKKTVDELRASEVCAARFLVYCQILMTLFSYLSGLAGGC